MEPRRLPGLVQPLPLDRMTIDTRDEHLFLSTLQRLDLEGESPLEPGTVDRVCVALEAHEDITGFLIDPAAHRDIDAWRQSAGDTRREFFSVDPLIRARGSERVWRSLRILAVHLDNVMPTGWRVYTQGDAGSAPVPAVGLKVTIEPTEVIR